MTSASTVGELYRLHAAGAVRRARQLLASEDQAQEAVQQVFLGLVERPEQLAGFSSFAAWLYGAVTHLCLNQLRNQRTRERLAGVVGLGGPHYLRVGLASHSYFFRELESATMAERVRGHVVPKLEVGIGRSF